jgi:hypothetical protein
VSIVRVLSDRHPAVRDIAQYFEYRHLPKELQTISKECHDLAEKMIQALPDCPMLTRGLDHLLQAKDAFVRANLPSAANAPASSTEY